MIDQSAVGVSTRSNPATYTGIMDEVRKAFATANKVSPSLFSFNSEGASENCQGLGVIYTEIPAMGEVKSPCEICEGKRFKDEVLAYKLNGARADFFAMEFPRGRPVETESVRGTPTVLVAGVKHPLPGRREDSPARLFRIRTGIRFQLRAVPYE